MLDVLYEAISTPGIRESAQINNMKKYRNFIGLGVEPTGELFGQIRRANLFAPCSQSSITTTRRRFEPFAIVVNRTDVTDGATR
jgi:tRNA-dihydrouridine synthase B